MLMELNPDVKGDYIEETCDQLLSNNPEFFCSFSVVIATGLNEKYNSTYKLPHILFSSKFHVFSHQVIAFLVFISLAS